jgi:nicotinamide-nucleotide amidase
VSEEDLAVHGAVSETVARAMARGVRIRSGASWGIAVTGIAGPSGGTPEKPVGTVHVAVDGASSSEESLSLHRALRLPGDRERIQTLTVAAALELLRRQLAPSPQEPR